uniref:Uncharacterized protein n=1 Tax=Peronospora matthiolae TaxID=2874970 RepID=A0AAV1VEU4_9STRA
MCRVVLLNQTQYVNHQLGAGLPGIPGRAAIPRATGRDNSSDVRSRRGGSTAAQLDSAGHRESPLMEVEEEERRSPHDHVDRCVPESFFDRHRAEFAFAQLENERALTSLRDELRVARGDVERSQAETTAFQILVDAHHREHKALCEMLERKGVLHRKKQRTDGTAYADQRKTWDAFASYVVTRSCMH